MKEFIEKLIGRLEEAKEHYRKEWNKHMDDEDYGNLSAYEDSINIVNQLAEEYNNTSTMTANEYQKLAARTMDKQLPMYQQELHSLHGMVGEVGELHSIYQKVYQGHQTTKESIEHRKKELGDLLWFIAEYCTCNGWELEDIMQMNIDKLKARYPDGFSANKSLNRKEGDI